MCFSEKNGLKSAFFRQRLPLSFSLYLKMDNRSFQKLFPKNFFDLIQPGVQGLLLCLRSKASERVARAVKKSQNHRLLSGHNFHASEVISIDTTIFLNHTGSEIILTTKVCTQCTCAVHTQCTCFLIFLFLKLERVASSIKSIMRANACLNYFLELLYYFFLLTYLK